MKYLNWKIGGLLLGLIFFLAIFLVKPIGASTQFSVTAGFIESTIDEGYVYEDSDNSTGYGSTNPYLNKNEGKLAKAIAKPLNYSNVFVSSILLGGVLSVLTSKTKVSKEENKSPKIFRERISSKTWVRFIVVFIGGLISIFGARLAGGCTSGHMMSGIMQTSLSGLLFATAVFAAAIPTSMIMYKKRR